MDGDDISQEEFSACMKDLTHVNTLTRTRPPTLGFVTKALEAHPGGGTPVILDVGFGAGDMLRAIEEMCQRRRLSARLIGIDRNPRSEHYARTQTAPSSRIDYRTGELYDLPEDEKPDLVISSQVTHHMHDDEIVRFVRWMEQHARLGWLVSDLHRHRLAYRGFQALARAMRWHRMVRHDGPVSIARSFTRADWLRYLRDAGLDPGSAAIEWHVPFRYTIARRKW